MIPVAALALAALAGSLGLTACGGGDEPALSAEADRGHQLADESGCFSCHGTEGEGGIGPAWNDLAGSTVSLEDGTTVTVDEDYLHRAIVDPAAEIVAGSSVVMPDNQLSDEDAAAIVAYIIEME
jgi:cytochrome c oxidase subunit 2